MWSLPRKIMRWKLLKNENIKKLDFCWDQEGHNGRGVELMYTMNFVASAIHILLRFKIFFKFWNWYYFCICKNSDFSFFIILWNCHGCGDAFKLFFGIIFCFQSQLLVTTWYQHMTQIQKVTPCLRHSCPNQIFRTCGQLYDMSKTCLRLSQPSLRLL